MRYDLHGAVVVVTGAASGIGKTTASVLASLGAQVIACDRDAKALGETSAGEGGTAQVDTMVCDIAEEDEVRELANQLEERYGRVDGLVNNAGVWWPEADGRLTSVPLATWNEMLRINLTGTYLMCREILPLMQPGSAVVNIASAAAVTGWPEMDAYTASKGGILSMTRAMSVEYGPGIRVNAICPGAIATPLTQDEQSRVGVPKNSIGRPGEPEEIAWPIAFLLSQASSFMTGEYLMVDGGRRSRL